jgi:hypothetical protein
MSKDLCDCGKIAIWSYGPGFSSGDNPNFCNDCVPRGCSCNYRYVDVNAYHPPLDNPDLPEGEEGKEWKWLDDEKTHWCYIDDKGREYPCGEYWYDEDGWEIEEEPTE